MGMTSTMPCRTKPRINASFTGKVRGVDARGKAFEVDVVVENLSAGGLYVRLPHQLRVDDEVFAFICLSCGRDSNAPPAGVAVRGVVVRSEPQLDGSCGVAISFKRYRLL
ncbi:MAG: hypothetical protein DME26_18910 [Verrucomicrobia bacterium]|nr:MAG: hypothetical protein DME26_18910 [Verrucomicrobiota bacterium]